MPILEGVSTHHPWTRRYFQHMFLKTAVFTVSFSNVRMLVPKAAYTLANIVFGKFIFPRTSGEPGENDEPTVPAVT